MASTRKCEHLFPVWSLLLSGCSYLLPHHSQGSTTERWSPNTFNEFICPSHPPFFQRWWGKFMNGHHNLQYYNIITSIDNMVPKHISQKFYRQLYIIFGCYGVTNFVNRPVFRHWHHLLHESAVTLGSPLRKIIWDNFENSNVQCF